MLEKTVLALNRITMAIGGVVLFAMMALACSNMCLRFFGLPVKGTFELMGFGGALIAALALGGTQEKKGHIQVNLLENTLPRRANTLLQSFSDFVALAFFGLLAWRLFLLARVIQQSGEVSETLHLAFTPIVAVVGLGFLVLSLNLVLQLVQNIRSLRSQS